ncbi:MAG: acyltransferase [Planctomycetes bacterium]|nr:acyltransferase [Planctomycetota bacterium]
MSHTVDRPTVSSATSDKIKILGLILTLFVVFHHAHNLQFATASVHPLVRGIESFFHYGLRGLAVPFFFICSAYFLCARRNFTSAYPGEVRKRVGSLLVPFLVWSCGWVLVMFAMQSIPALAPMFGRDVISFAHPLDVLRLVTLDPIPHPLWYMRDLFLLAILSPLIVWVLSSRVGSVLYAAGSLALWYSVPSIQLREAQDLFFFGVGAWIAIHRPQVPVVPMWAKLVLLGGSIGLLSYHCWWVDARGEEQAFLLNTAVLLGLPAIWLLYDDVAGTLRTPRLLAWSEYALFIYMAHEPALTIVRKGMIGYTGSTSTALLVVWAASGTLVIACAVAAAWILRTFVPSAYAILTGGRVPRRPVSAVADPAVPAITPSPA